MAKADIFKVWGEPPKALTRGMTEQQIRLLKQYMDGVTGRCYRLAFDNGISHAFGMVSSTVQKAWKKQRNAMLRS